MIKESDSLRVYADLAQTIGNTPLVHLGRVTTDVTCSVYAKLEMLNPGGSVKDRIAFSILDAYEAEGSLKPGGTVVEATSGNTGVGLAIACSLRGYKSVFVLPDKMSQEKVSMLRAFGARVVVTPTAVPPEDPRSYYSVADRIVRETPGAVLANQYHNPANPQSHYQSTAPEIWEQTEGNVTDIVCGMGTGGTITGIARFVRENNLDVRIVGIDPQGSILYDAWKQKSSGEGLEAQSYLVEGIGEDFIPSTLELGLVDEVIQVSDAEAFTWTRRLVREEGIFCGGSSGAAMAGAMKYAEKLSSDRNIVVVLPDSGSRYLSKVFDDDWMREHGFSLSEGREAMVMDVANARGAMTLKTAREDEPLREVVDRMRAHAISQLPVVDGDGRYIGVVSELDLLNALVEMELTAREEQTLEQIKLIEAPTVPSDLALSMAAPMMNAHKVVVVVDENQRPTGVITVIDVLTWMSEQGAE